MIDVQKVKARACRVLYEVDPSGVRLPDPEPDRDGVVEAALAAD